MENAHGALTPKEIFLIGAGWNEGSSNREIAAQLGRSHTTINNFMHKIFPPEEPTPQQLAEEMAKRQKRLEKRVKNLVMDAMVMSSSARNRALSCRRLSQTLKEEWNIECSRQKISRMRRENGLKYEFTRKTERLTPHQMEVRANWATLVRNYHMFRWVWVITDECMIVADPVRRKIWLFPGETSECVQQCYQGHSAVRLMFWAAIAPGYKSALIVFEEHVTAKTYKQMLIDNHIFEQLRAAFPAGYIFQQDNAPAHKAGLTLDYLEQNTTLLAEPFEWPPYSPDVSPIEQIWSLLKRMINMSAVHTKADLAREATLAWNMISQATVDRHAIDLPNRVLALEDLKGAPLAGHRDMIKLYRQGGLAVRDQAQQLIHAHEVPPGWDEKAQELILDLLQPPGLDGATIEEQELTLNEYENAWEEHKSLLPLRRRG
jgi:transposase